MSGQEDFFPIEIPCSYIHGHSCMEFRDEFLAVRPANMHWYAYDVIIKGPTSIVFVVYNMRDNLRGGVGDEIARLKSECSEAKTKLWIEAHAFNLALKKLDAFILAIKYKLVKVQAQITLAKVYRRRK